MRDKDNCMITEVFLSKLHVCGRVAPSRKGVSKAVYLEHLHCVEDIPFPFT